MTNLERGFMFFAGTVAAAGVLLQADLTCRICFAQGAGLGTALLKAASDFTFLTNLLVAVSYFIAALGPHSAPGRFLVRPSVRTGLFLYIGLAALFYVLFLSPRWDPRGWQMVANVLLHYVTPALYLLFWLLFVPGSLLPWRLAGQWLFYPAVYLGFVLARGSWTQDYPDLLRMANAPDGLLSWGLIVAGLGAFLAGGLCLIQLCRVRAQRAERAAEAARQRAGA